MGMGTNTTGITWRRCTTKRYVRATAQRGALTDLKSCFQLFTIDAPLAPGYSSEDEAESGLSQTSRDHDEEEAGPSVDSETSDKDESDRPSISLPDDLFDIRSASSSPSLPSRKGKEKAPLWHDPADDLVNVDLNGEKRMRKLARGKGGDGKVRGKELEKRLREQCVSVRHSNTDRQV